MGCEGHRISRHRVVGVHRESSRLWQKLEKLLLVLLFVRQLNFVFVIVCIYVY